MQSNHSWFQRGIPVIAVCGITLALGISTFRAQADTWDKKTVLTVSQPIQVQDTYLEPGTYVFKLASSSSDRHIVQIFDQDQRRLINTFLAIPNYRLQPTGDSRFTFYETPAGTARAMRAWFYPGDNFGQEFRYPKHLHPIATLTPQRGTPLAEPVAASAAQADQPEPKAVEQAVVEPPKEERREVAMLETPAAAPEPAPAPAPEPSAAPEPAPEQAQAAPPSELPKTASTYPLMGLCGLTSLALVGLLRLRRAS